MEGSVALQVPSKDTVSIRHYFQEFIKGMDITAFVFPDTNQVLAGSVRLHEDCQVGSAMGGHLSQQALEDILCKAVLGSMTKPNAEAKLPRNPS